jgi:outer membrane biosynthesis protein TonB
MRYDYGLYGVAIICFIIAIIFAGSFVPGYELTGSNWAAGVTVSMIFIVLGIISAALGYSARPKPIMPAPQPTPPPPTPAAIPTPPAEPVIELSSPPSPPAEEVSPEPSPVMPPEPSPPTPTPAAELEQPAAVMEEEKPKEKPPRRRRRKTEKTE